MFNAQSNPSAHSVLSPDGSTIASLSSDGHIKLWQCEGGISHYDHKRRQPSIRFWSVHISADEQKIICGSSNETIVVFDSHTGEFTETIHSSSRVHSMDVSHTASLVITLSGDQLLLWDYRNPKFNATAQTDVDDFRVHVLFSIDGSQVIVHPTPWDSSKEKLFIERWEISQSPLGLRCLGRERPERLTERYQRLTERSELPHRISEDQWVVDRDGRRVCWIPPEWRSPIGKDVSKSKFVVCMDSERMLIVDLPNVPS
jgi:WD40 repeat protein